MVNRKLGDFSEKAWIHEFIGKYIYLMDIGDVNLINETNDVLLDAIEKLDVIKKREEA